MMLVMHILCLEGEFFRGFSRLSFEISGSKTKGSEICTKAYYNFLKGSVVSF